uniref:Uncharacterized protein n=1 Tax=Parastrongyloides trichosuri TaxID=131310 RepID=A0A0N4ZJ41_PARTI
MAMLEKLLESAMLAESIRLQAMRSMIQNHSSLKEQPKTKKEKMSEMVGDEDDNNNSTEEEINNEGKKLTQQKNNNNSKKEAIIKKFHNNDNNKKEKNDSINNNLTKFSVTDLLSNFTNQLGKFFLYIFDDDKKKYNF